MTKRSPSFAATALTAKAARSYSQSRARSKRFGVSGSLCNLFLGIVPTQRRRRLYPWTAFRVAVALPSIRRPLDDVEKDRHQEDAEYRHAQHAAEHRYSQRPPHFGGMLGVTIFGIFL